MKASWNLDKENVMMSFTYIGSCNKRNLVVMVSVDWPQRRAQVATANLMSLVFYLRGHIKSVVTVITSQVRN